ncbi:unnamed protein product [Cyberlindnera jadinii]|uniref:Uncharacterized protein n=1 Tax=Cyberlindnera jadinii (strain ATCC 18201 / CBS 1600 / BCRC 20928 / JCM 3617 / NBRC 0987 / NRRL Y-1542) TaxID=983966 RepID=A0A0H5C788_CYBJN|nr:unnamed protein product [Cyberlindnera jadinii]
MRMITLLCSHLSFLVERSVTVYSGAPGIIQTPHELSLDLICLQFSVLQSLRRWAKFDVFSRQGSASHIGKFKEDEKIVCHGSLCSVPRPGEDYLLCSTIWRYLFNCRKHINHTVLQIGTSLEVL